MSSKTNAPTQTNNEQSQFEAIKAFFKKHKLPEDLKQFVANQLGQATPISEILNEILQFNKKNFKDYPSQVKDRIAIHYLRELIRTCNPNDNKFNSKKYGEAYQEGQREYLQNMGADLRQIVGDHIKNLKGIMSNVTFDVSDLKPREYTAISKDIMQMANLYQAMVAPQPNSGETLGILPAETQKALPSTPQPNSGETLGILPAETQKALPSTPLAIEEKPDEEDEENNTD